jgi:hypothetical protein
MTIKEYIDKLFRDKIYWCSNPFLKIKLNNKAEVAATEGEAVAEISCDVSDPKGFCPPAKQ